VRFRITGGGGEGGGGDGVAEVAVEVHAVAARVGGEGGGGDGGGSWPRGGPGSSLTLWTSRPTMRASSLKRKEQSRLIFSLARCLEGRVRVRVRVRVLGL
jgi:hypothetical protein